MGYWVTRNQKLIFPTIYFKKEPLYFTFWVFKLKANFLLSRKVAHISTFMSRKTCLAVCFSHSNSFTKLTPDGCTYHIFVRVFFTIAALKVNIWYTQAVKIRPISWGHLKRNYIFYLWTLNSNMEGLLVFKIRIGEIK